jgi:hypothetical protein
VPLQWENLRARKSGLLLLPPILRIRAQTHGAGWNLFAASSSKSSARRAVALISGRFGYLLVPRAERSGGCPFRRVRGVDSDEDPEAADTIVADLASTMERPKAEPPRPTGGRGGRGSLR